jgi:hypothetical protein
MKIVVPVVAGVVVLAALFGGGAVLVGRRHSSAITYPKSWDPRVEALVSFVQQNRGLTFKHPVAVDFLTPEQYHKVMTTDASSVSAKDRQDLERATGLLRGVGLLTGKVDLLNAMNTLSDDGTLAAYSPTTKRIEVRGTELTPSLRVTLAHELTHVAQDQYFDLTRTFADSASDSVFRSIVEGDAVRIENKYVDQLSPADLAAYDKQSAAEADPAALKDVPPALTAFFDAPYTLGSDLVALLAETGGNGAVDDAMRTPPTNEAQLLDPFRFIHHELPETVKTPALDKGDKRIDDSDFGALSLYFMLAGRIDEHAALRAADAWDGDASLDYLHNGRACVRVAIEASNASGADQLESALTAWTRTVPGADATVARTGQLVSFQSCDPGENAVAPSGNGASAEQLDLPSARAEIALSLIQDGMGNDEARCRSGAVVDVVPLDQLGAGPESLDPKLLGQVQQLVLACEGK